VKELLEEEYEVLCMKTTSTTPPTFFWPEREDKLKYAEEEIMMSVPAPTKCPGSSRRQKFQQLPTSVVANIEETFAHFK
jgi:H2-forming N5,N10-methylenetetrahydromethanopterin dehydrogenase-like enzyme